MATEAHCLYCFEVISASLEGRPSLDLPQVETLWRLYNAPQPSEDDPHTGVGIQALPSKSAARSSTLISAAPPSSSSSNPEFPLFVTWNTLAKSGSKRLRGCIGTFESQKLDYGLKTYALTAYVVPVPAIACRVLTMCSAFEDSRFSPIDARELPTLECGVTLLTNFETAPDPMAWEIGKHGLRISFTHHSRRYGATYLPDVAYEQGWTKSETLISLMHKAGWRGRDDDWRKVADLKVVRYQGSKATTNYTEWKSWKDWAIKQEESE